jgi:N-acetyl-anhydromuramyl-L-alanine amidase AmpD
VAQSKEWPDLKWIPPKSYTNDNRTKSDIKWVVIHDTEGSSNSESAENGAEYNQRRTDGTSAHYFVDNNSVVHCVVSADRAHTARATGNRYGIQYELCGRASWQKSTWLNDYGRAMLERAAKQVARDCEKFDIPVRHLTVAQVRNKERGLCSHWDITRAFPEDNGTHTDPGPNFPWTEFLNMVRAELAPEPVEDDMATAEEVWKYRLKNAYSGIMQEAGSILSYVPSASWHQTTHQLLADQAAMIVDLTKLVQQLAAGEAVDDAVMASIDAKATAIKERVDKMPVVEDPEGDDGTVQV